ncbi:MAG: universal stress protein [Burkholderiales bacterium]|nr:universal stress protein [Burkholderiales bacterium]
MYQHLLVPVDDSELSVANVGEAVRLARSFAAPAKVTFFHATPDYGASVEGSRAKAHLQDRLHRAPLFAEGSALRVPELSAEAFRERVLGSSRALLAKACAAAAAAEVAFDTHSIVSDDPAEAIVRAARDTGCDLIVMASHGRTGLRALLSPSIATKVMRHAGVPVLVTRTEGTDAQVEASRAIALIQDEHRSLAAVIYGMKRRVADARDGAAGLDHEFFGRLVAYIQGYPEKRHHPKEEESLHRLLRERGDEGRELMHRLEAQHLQEYQLAAALHGAWAACGAGASGVDPKLGRLAEAVEALAAHVWEHMRQEEELLLPLAKQVLRPDDWKEVAEAFEGGGDSGFGQLDEADLRHLFTSMANAARLPQADLRKGD